MVKNEANEVQQKKGTKKWMIEQIPGRLSKYNGLIVLLFKQEENSKVKTVLVMSEQISYEFHQTALKEHPEEQGFIKIQENRKFSSCPEDI